MKLSRILAVNIVALTMFTPRIFAQADGCRGAVSALNRVKEQITPQLSTATPAGKDRLEVMFSTLKTASTACSDMAEIWHYRQVVAKRLGNVKETTFAQGRLEKLQYEEQFDPFTPPPAALPPPPGLQIASDKVRKKWALVVGIDEFKDPTLHQLRYAVKDSTDFDNFLTDPQRGRFPAQQVKHLVNQQATLKGIREGLGWLRVNVQPEDMVAIYFASHGSPRNADPNGVSYILTNDTDVTSPEELYATSLQMIDLVQEINREIRARRVVLILDTCFSGDAQTPAAQRGVVLPPARAASSVAFSEALQNLKVGFGRAVITASQADETSWESAVLENGYFTHFLIDALSGSGGSPPLKDVFAVVREKVSESVSHEQHGARQNPTCEFSEQADSITLGALEST